MKPAPFEYCLPTTLTEAIDALSADGAKVLAGGQSLIPLMALRLASFETLVDLRVITELRGSERVNGSVRVGAMTRQADAEQDTVIGIEVPLLAKALPKIGHFQIRNQGTVGGSIAHADPAAELPTVALALDATIEAAGPAGTRRIPASEFFRATFDTALDDAEILTAIEFPVWRRRRVRRRGAGPPQRRLRARRRHVRCPGVSRSGRASLDRHVRGRLDARPVHGRRVPAPRRSGRRSRGE